MTSSPDQNGPSPHPAVKPLPSDAEPQNWQSALIELVTSRIDLIRLESKDAAQGSARRIFCVLAAVIAAFFTWALVVVATIGAVAALSGWSWYWLTFAAAALHVAAAVALIFSAKSPAPPAFSATRAEFQKDREWIESLTQNPKSND